MGRRHTLTDGQWDRIKDRVPDKACNPGRNGEDKRRFLDAVAYVC